MKGLRDQDWTGREVVRVHASPVGDLPPAVFECIGKIAVKASMLDYALMQIVYALTGIDRRIGRIAVRTPRAAEMLDMISELLVAKSLKSAPPAKSLRTRIEKVTSERDMLVHSLWMRGEKGELSVVSMSGAAPKGSHTSNKRRLDPIAIPWDYEACNSVLSEFDNLFFEVIVYLGVLTQEIGESHEKLRAPPLQK